MSLRNKTKSFLPKVFMEELEDAENEDKKPYKPGSTEMEGLWMGE